MIMKSTIPQQVLRICFIGCILGSGALAIAEDSNTQSNFNTYAAIQLTDIANAKSNGVKVGMGGPVVVKGSLEMAQGVGVGFVLGREFQPQDANESSQPKRLELEYWSGSLKESRLVVGAVNLLPNSQNSANAVLLSGWMRVNHSESNAVWIGAGVGQGSVKYPNLTTSIPGCKCMGDLKTTGAAWKLQMSFEHSLSLKDAVYLKVAYLNLPGGQITGTPSTQYGSSGLVNLSGGFKRNF